MSRWVRFVLDIIKEFIERQLYFSKRSKQDAQLELEKLELEKEIKNANNRENESNDSVDNFERSLREYNRKRDE